MISETFNFDPTFENGLLARLIRDYEFFKRNSGYVREVYFGDRFKKDIWRLSEEWIEEYQTPIDEISLRQKIDEMYRKQLKQDVYPDEYHAEIAELFRVDLSTLSEEYAEDKIRKFAQTRELAEKLNRGLALLDEGKNPDDALTSTLEGFQKVLEIGEIKTTKILTPTLEDYMMMKFEERKMILSPWLKEKSIGELAGWRGSGKTWVLTSLLEAITKDQVYGPWETVTPVPCLYVDGELAADELQERFQLLRQVGTRKAPLYIYNDDHMKSQGAPKASLLKPEWREFIMELIADKEIKFAVFDNLSALSGGANPYDENAKKDWEPINSWLLDLKHKGCSSLFVHHTGYSGTQRGTTGREDNLNYSILLEQPQGYKAEMGCRFTLRFTKARVQQNELPLIQAYNFELETDEDGKVDWAWSKNKKSQKIEILRLLDSGVSQSAIAKSLKITPANVSKTKAKAIKLNQMTEDGKLTDRGKELVKGSLDLVELADDGE